MRAGLLRYRVELQKPISVERPGGEPAITWQTLKHLFINMTGAGSEQLASGQQEGRIAWIIEAHADTDIQPQCRFVMGARVFDIISVVPSKSNIALSVDILASERFG